MSNSLRSGRRVYSFSYVCAWHRHAHPGTRPFPPPLWIFHSRLLHPAACCCIVPHPAASWDWPVSHYVLTRAAAAVGEGMHPPCMFSPHGPTAATTSIPLYARLIGGSMLRASASVVSSAGTIRSEGITSSRGTIRPT